MTEYGLYEVLGTREYRGHAPGEQFEAQLERNAERRAVMRGSIQLLRRVTPALEPGSFRIHEAWLSQSSTPTTEAREGLSH